MLLLDSSVWIDVHLGRSTDATRYVHSRDEHEEIATTGIIFQEVLQGVRDPVEYEYVRQLLWSALILEPREMQTFELAVQLYLRARDKKLTIRKSTNCVIAALALEHGALLVHNDVDFIALAETEPALLIYPGRPH
jgi:predicted nucleic acid-binding protein